MELQVFEKSSHRDLLAVGSTRVKPTRYPDMEMRRTKCLFAMLLK